MLFKIAISLFVTGLLVGIAYAIHIFRNALQGKQLETNNSADILIGTPGDSSLSRFAWSLKVILLLMVIIPLFGFTECVQSGFKKIASKSLAVNLIQMLIVMSYYWALITVVTMEKDESKSLDFLTFSLIMGTILGIICAYRDSIKPSS